MSSWVGVDLVTLSRGQIVGRLQQASSERDGLGVRPGGDIVVHGPSKLTRGFTGWFALSPFAHRG